MKAILALAAAVLAAPALVAADCVNKVFGTGNFPQPCDCPASYTIYQNDNCQGASVHLNIGGWHTADNAWRVRSYECDAVSLTSNCVNQSFGRGTFQKPCDCPAGYTIYQNANCGGATVTIKSGGWVTGPNAWPVQAYKCDNVSQPGRCINKAFGKGSFGKPAECIGSYYIYQNAGCGGASVHLNSGWTTGPTQWNVQAYKCDPAPIKANRCINHSFGEGTFPKPSQCTATGYTIYQGEDCTGATVHLDGGWTTRPGNWPVKSFRCDDGCTCTARTAFNVFEDAEYFEAPRTLEDSAPEEEDVVDQECHRFNVQ
ncbi:hypothetical protein DFQ27_005716 [Actinomortierella ambigua]|uniref:Uncharacterized protein n=1 Tax=Actinomortierella ambigua TaxID=1343610 RepID=A0A9P6QLW7_9FUNG|nr:hypothetical protein DFQ27_005716 [Actinomortierella ambigua]